MTEPQIIDAPRPNHSTGPKTEKGKKVCSLNAYRHGLTGQLNVLTPDEQQAYDKHSKIVLEGLAPAGNFERDIAQSIADDRWRLKRARTIESSMFAMGMRYSDENTGSPQVDDAFAQVLTWTQDARNLNLLTIYTQRIQRSVDKNTAYLESLQTKRQQLATEDMRQAKLLYQLAQAEGKPYQPEKLFSTAPAVRESVFSTPEITRELNLHKSLYDAKVYDYSGHLPQKKVAKAPACESSEELQP
jgi:hypothetical protein